MRINLARITFGTALGGVFLAVGILFAAIDSVILFKGWGNYGLDWADKLSYGLSAASIPWVVAGYPFVWWVLWLRGRLRAVFPLAVAGLVYLVLIAYSLIGAMGSIATQRQQVIADKTAAHDSRDALVDQRNRYRNELGWIQAHRPPAQVEADIARIKINRQWEWSSNCRDITNGNQRKFCTEYEALRGELAAARKSEEIHKRVADLSAQIDHRAPVSEKADPMAATLTLWLRKAGFQVSESEASMGLPITTPVILLIGEMVFVWFGFMLLGIDHRKLMAGHLQAEVPRLTVPAVRVEAVGVGGQSVPALPPPLQQKPDARVAVSLTRQAELCTWFFRTCMRHAPDGSLPETDWYRHYCDVCAQSGDEPLPLAGFRRFAEKHVPSIKQVEGVIYYRQVLPLIPKESAA